MKTQPATVTPPADQPPPLKTAPSPNGDSPNGSPNPNRASRSGARRSGNRLRMVAIIGLVLAVAAAGVTAFVLTSGTKGPRADLILHKVKYEPVQLTVVERGALESADNREIICRVRVGMRATLSISWVIDDGTPVKAGDRVMEIEDTELLNQLISQEILMEQARMAMIGGESNYNIVRSQNESLIALAEIAVELARLDLEKYRDGDYKFSLDEIRGRLKVAAADLQLQQQRTDWTDRMARRDYMSEQQLKAEQLRRQSMEVALEKINGELRMLDMFTKPRTLTDLNAKYTEAQRALERTKAEAKAKEEQARIERETKKKVFEKELMRYKDIEEQIRRCIITAPQDGIVVYYVSEQAARGMGSQQSIIAQNEPVREGQKLMRIPDLRRMVVNTKVHEAMISRIRGDLWQSTGFVDTLRVVSAVQPDAIGSFVADQAVHELRERFREQEMKKVADGMRATIRIEAFPDQLFHGHVKSVATVAAKTDWTSADVKTYQTMVSIDESLVGLKPDMNAEVTIYVDSTDQPVLTVPLQAVVGGTELGRTRKVFVMTPEGPKERDVVIGLSNEKLVEVKEGLEEGEEVILNPKVILGDKVKTRQVIEGDPRGGEGGGRGKGKGGRGGKSKFGGGIPPDGGMPGGGGGSK